MITIQDFKDYFYRDFPYLPIWIATNTYNQGDIIYYDINKLFYTCKNNNTTSIPTDTIDWIVTSDDIYNYVLDEDITKAITEMSIIIPMGRFDVNSSKLAQLYLTAHCLCNDIKTSNAGLASQIIFPVQSKGAGGINESYGIPKRFLDREIYAFYITSQYGLKYLAILIPRIRGNIGIAMGATTP